jgi:hypothetical protein
VVQAFRFFAEMFPEVAILGFHKGRVQVLLVGSRAGVRPLSIAVEAPLQEDSLIWSVLTRPQMCYRTNVTDRTLADLCRASGLIAADIALIPAFDSGRPIFLVLGQGRSEAQVHASFETTKDFLTKIGKALKIVALKNELRTGQ